MDRERKLAPLGAGRARLPVAFCFFFRLNLPSSPSSQRLSLPEIGVGLTGFGVLFTVLGVMFFFDKGLLAMGNVSLGAGKGARASSHLIDHSSGRRPSLLIPSSPSLSPLSPSPLPSVQILFLSGVALTIGPRSTLRFFTRRRNARGSAFFGGGLLLVLAGWAVVGMAVEAYGFWLLFAGFFPTVLGFLRRAPGLGPVLDLPILKSVRFVKEGEEREREGREGGRRGGLGVASFLPALSPSLSLTKPSPSSLPPPPSFTRRSSTRSRPPSRCRCDAMLCVRRVGRVFRLCPAVSPLFLCPQRV
jgi:hypothetical protein